MSSSILWRQPDDGRTHGHEGRLPSVVVRRGRVQKTRRISRVFVDRMVADACAGAQVDMEEYVAAWLAEHALAQPAGELGFPS